MKLNTSQIETIEHYLLDWGLEYADFYNEVLDHFISGIESKMIKAASFDMAFANTKSDFKGKRFKDFRGLKAFEMEFSHGLKKEFKRSIRSKTKEQFTSYRLLLWVVIAFGFYKNFFNEDRIIWFFGSSIIVMIVVPFFLIPLKDYRHKGLSRYGMHHVPVSKRKKGSLYQNTRQRFFDAK